MTRLSQDLHKKRKIKRTLPSRSVVSTYCDNVQEFNRNSTRVRGKLSKKVTCQERCLSNLGISYNQTLKTTILSLLSAVKFSLLTWIFCILMCLYSNTTVYVTDIVKLASSADNIFHLVFLHENDRRCGCSLHY